MPHQFLTSFISILQHWYDKMLLKPLAGSGTTTSKHPFVHPNHTVRNVWRVAQKRYWIKHFGSAETLVAFFLAPRFLHTSNGFSMILTHVKSDFGCRAAKSLFSDRVCKQKWIGIILCFCALEGLASAPRVIYFARCFKTPAMIKILRREATFCAVATAAWQIYFWGERDLKALQVMIFQHRENASKINENQWKWSIYDNSKHKNIQNQRRIISKIESLQITQFDQLPRAPKERFMSASLFASKPQRQSKYTPFRPC